MAVTDDAVLPLLERAPRPAVDGLGIVQVGAAVGSTAIGVWGIVEGTLAPLSLLGVGTLGVATVGLTGQLRSRQARRDWRAWAEAFDERRESVVAALAGTSDDEAYQAGLTQGTHLLGACRSVPPVPRDAGYRDLEHGSRLLRWIANSLSHECPRFSDGLRVVATRHEAAMATTDG